MAKRNRRDVVPGKNGGWDITAPGGRRASGIERTQGHPEHRPQHIVHNIGAGEVPPGRDGRIRSKDTAAPGNDPKPSKDREH
jgi:hypothetical protein